jgi:hypothetical protein
MNTIVVYFFVLVYLPFFIKTHQTLYYLTSPSLLSYVYMNQMFLTVRCKLLSAIYRHQMYHGNVYHMFKYYYIIPAKNEFFKSYFLFYHF